MLATRCPFFLWLLDTWAGATPTTLAPFEERFFVPLRWTAGTMTWTLCDVMHCLCQDALRSGTEAAAEEDRILWALRARWALRSATHWCALHWVETSDFFERKYLALRLEQGHKLVRAFANCGWLFAGANLAAHATSGCLHALRFLHYLGTRRPFVTDAHRALVDAVVVAVDGVWSKARVVLADAVFIRQLRDEMKQHWAQEALRGWAKAGSKHLLDFLLGSLGAHPNAACALLHWMLMTEDLQEESRDLCAHVFAAVMPLATKWLEPTGPDRSIYFAPDQGRECLAVLALAHSLRRGTICEDRASALHLMCKSLDRMSLWLSSSSTRLFWSGLACWPLPEGFAVSRCTEAKLTILHAFLTDVIVHEPLVDDGLVDSLRAEVSRMSVADIHAVVALSSLVETCAACLLDAPDHHHNQVHAPTIFKDTCFVSFVFGAHVGAN